MGNQGKREWPLTILFTLMMAGSIYTIFHLELPRLGSDLDIFEQELVSLRRST